MQKSCRRNVPPISFSFRPNRDAPDPVSLSSDLLYLAGTALNWVCTPNVTSNVMRRSASNSFPATAFRSTRHGRSGTTFALVPACHHLPPRVADQMVGVACCLRRLRAAWATPSSSRPRLPKWHHQGHQPWTRRPPNCQRWHHQKNPGCGPKTCQSMRTPPSAQNPRFGAQGIMRARNCDMAYWVTDSRSENVKGGGSTVGLGVVADNLLSWRGRNAIHGSSRRLVPTFGIQIQGGCKVAQCSRLGTHTDRLTGNT